jgi:hypothetical protein
MPIFSSQHGMEDKAIVSLGIILLIALLTLVILVFSVIRLNARLNMFSEYTFVIEDDQPGSEYVCFPVNSGVEKDMVDSFIPPID